MRHQAVNIAVQRDGRVLVTEDFRQRFDIYAALQRAGSKGVPQGMKSAMRNADPTKQQTETVLIRTHRLHLVLSDNKGGGGLFLLLPQKRQQLLRNRNDMLSDIRQTKIVFYNSIPNALQELLGL